jgi:hypothetical protein
MIGIKWDNEVEGWVEGLKSTSMDGRNLRYDLK